MYYYSILYFSVIAIAFLYFRMRSVMKYLKVNLITFGDDETKNHANILKSQYIKQQNKAFHLLLFTLSTALILLFILVIRIILNPEINLENSINAIAELINIMVSIGIFKLYREANKNANRIEF